MDVAAITFRSPKKMLPGEEFLAHSLHFSADLQHPPAGHILNPETDMDIISDECNVVIAGSKLSAVDALLVLYERGYFEKPGHKVTLVSPHGRLLSPYETTSPNVEAYKRHAFLSDPAVPDRLRNPKTAKDLADFLVLNCLYATGATYDGTDWTLPPQADSVAKRLSEIASKIIARLEEEKEFIIRKFAQNRTAYGWQIALDEDFRPNIEKIWKTFDITQRKLWVRSSDHQDLFDDLRLRILPKIHDLLVDLNRQGNVIITQGTVFNLMERGDKIQVVAANGNSQILIECDQLIKATGPEKDYPLDKNSLFHDMRKQGMLHEDAAINIGMVVSENNAHNLLFVGWLNRTAKYLIGGMIQIREHGAKEAVRLREMLQAQRDAGEHVSRITSAGAKGMVRN